MTYNQLSQKIIQYLPDDFSKELLSCSTQILKDKDNALRIHFFSMGIRELISYTLHKLAPDNNIENCVWFKPETNNGKPTRKQRMKYIVQGGLDQRFIREKLCISAEEINDILRKLVIEYDTLSSLVHIRPDTTKRNNSDILKRAKECLNELFIFFDMIFTFKEHIKNSLEENIFDRITQDFFEETFDDIDILASHYWIETIEIQEVDVIDINDENVTFKVDGAIEVGLQWGSDSDVRNDIGALGEVSFPFTCQLYSTVKKPTTLKIIRQSIQIDTSDWYQ